jgi:PAS domain S-box-containing protein
MDETTVQQNVSLILVVDDDRMMRRMVRRALESRGYAVEEAEDGAQALSAYERLQPDIVLLDILMPEMDGFATLARLQALPGGDRTPVLMITAFDDKASVDRAFEAGATDYITKPIHLEVLRHRVHRLLRARQAEEALRKWTHELGERVKELNCLYSISDLVEKPGISLEEILQGTVDLIPPAWQYPEITCARLILEGQEFRTENFRETIWKQTDGIVVHGERVGTVEVCYLEERPESDEGLFLKEERSLLNAIAERLGGLIERKQAEEALKASEAKYRELVQNANSIILRLDTQGRITFFNEFAQSFFDCAEDEILGQNIVGTIVPERETSGRDLAAMIQDMVQHPEQYTTNENENMRRNGERVWVAWTNKAIFDDEGRVAEILSVGNDITERKRFEERMRQQDRMAALGHLRLDFGPGEHPRRRAAGRPPGAADSGL